MLLLEQMIVLFIIMGAGFLCYKPQIITDEVNKTLSAIVVNIANPGSRADGDDLTPKLPVALNDIRAGI